MPMVKRHSHFARHLENVWEQLAGHVHGQFTQGGTWKTDKIRIESEDWIVTLEMRSVPGFKSEELFTRLRAPLVNPDRFRFTVHPRSLLSRAAVALGLSPVESDDRQLEKHYVIHSNDHERVREVFADEEVRARLLRRGDATIWVGSDEESRPDASPDDVDELCCEVPDSVDDLEALEGLYRLFASVLQKTCNVVSAYEGAA
jgi:hypothetical protein